MRRDDQKKSGNSTGPSGAGSDFWASILGDALSEAASRLGKILPESSAPMPAEDVTLPESDATLPEEDLTVPEADLTLPEENLTLPEEDMTVPEADLTQPEEDLTLPESSATLPEASATLPEAGLTLPEVAGGESLTLPETSATAPETVGGESLTLPEPAGKPVPVHIPVQLTDSIRPGETLLGTYRIDSSPIQGGMGRVWRVHHAGWNVDLAMKRPKPEFFRSERDKDNFTQECRSWINLGLHPNIVSCYYVREIDGVPTIFSEWMDGGSAEKKILDGTLYDGAKAEVQVRLLDLAIQFARGLQYAHENGLIHQDVKPDNLLLSEKGEAKVSDFGLAKARSFMTPEPETGRGRSGRKRKTGAKEKAAGDGAFAEFGLDVNATQMAPTGGRTPAYCSPEQAAGLPLSRRTDIFSWAVSVMEMYLGGKPWARGRDLTGPIAGAACRDYFDMCPADHRIPDSMQDLLAQCMEADPEQRPHDFAAVENRLLEIYEEVTGDEYPRPVPRAAADTADSLNNRALSMIDIGETGAAEKLWEEALRRDVHHVDARFNRELLFLRSGRKFDFEVIEELERYEETQKAGCIDAIAGEYPGAVEQVPEPFLAGGEGRRDVVRAYAVSLRGGQMRVSGERGTDGTGRWGTAVFAVDGDTRYLDWSIVINPEREDLTFPSGKYPVYAEYTPDGRMAAVMLYNNTAILLDTSARKIIGRSERVRDLKHVRFCWFHPDGTLLAAVFQDQVFVLSMPDLKLLAHLKKTEWVGIWRDGRCLLRRKTGRSQAALFLADLRTCLPEASGPESADGAGKSAQGQAGESGSSAAEDQKGPDEAGKPVLREPVMEEVFRFEKPLEEIHEYVRGSNVFLAYLYKTKNAEPFYLDDTFTEHPLPRRITDTLGSIPFYDAARGLLCTGGRSAGRFFFWEAGTLRFLYSVGLRVITGSNGHYDSAVLDEEKERILLWTRRGYAVFQPLALPSTPLRSRPAEWRLSRVVEARDRLAQEDQLAVYRRQFRKCLKEGDQAGLVEIYQSCLDIPGFSGSETAWNMADTLERTAKRGRIHALHYAAAVGSTPEYPDFGSWVPCGNGQTAGYSQDDPAAGVRIFDRDGNRVRLVPLPETAVRVFVRGERILVYGKKMDSVVLDLEGRPVDPLKAAPEDWSWPDYNNQGKYGIPFVLEPDAGGDAILYAVDRPFDPQRRKQVQGVFHKKTASSAAIRIQNRYDPDLKPVYLRDGTILVPPVPALRKPGFGSEEPEQPEFILRQLEAERGQVIREFRIGPGKMSTSDMCDLILNPERELFLVRTKVSYKWHFLLFGMGQGLLHLWTEELTDPFFLPGGRYLCFRTGERVGKTVLHIWDILQGETAYRLPLDRISAVCARPDGREIWVRDATAKGAVMRYRIEYSYE